ncbi:MAG: hypothetical protein GC204_05440 [Chloroflexi bacterium]|nr:hypothetical protein [Chloroflexota bacterium]
MDFTTLLSLLGPISIMVALIVVGLLSKQLGVQTNAKPFYLGFYGAAILVLISIAAQFLDLIFHFPHNDAVVLWIFMDDGLPAIAVTIGVIFSWRYWSWLLAERD